MYRPGLPIAGTGGFATVTGTLTPGNAAILTAKGIADSGLAFVETVTASTVYSNNTSATAAPQFNTTLALGLGTAALPSYTITGDTDTGMYSPAANQIAVTGGGNRLVQMRSGDTTNFMEYIYSGGVIWRARNTATDTTAINATLASNGIGVVNLSSNGAGTNGIMGRFTPSGAAGDANNYINFTTGVTGSGPSMGPVAQATGDTNIDINIEPLGTGVIRSLRYPYVLRNTSIAAGAATQAFIKASVTADFGIYFGTGDPGFAAAKGSLYTKTNATTTTTRLWVNTDGSTTWANFTSSA